MKKCFLIYFMFSFSFLFAFGRIKSMVTYFGLPQKYIFRSEAFKVKPESIGSKLSQKSNKVTLLLFSFISPFNLRFLCRLICLRCCRYFYICLFLYLNIIISYLIINFIYNMPKYTFFFSHEVNLSIITK